jgi:MFS family permease
MGWLSDKIGARPLCTAGLALISLSFFLLSRLGSEATIFDLIPWLVIMGIGIAVFRSPNASIIMGSAPKDNLGSASALMTTVSSVGMTSSMALAGAIYTSRQAVHAAEMAAENISPELLEKLSLVSGFQDTMFIVAVIGCISVFTTLIRNRKPVTGTV